MWETVTVSQLFIYCARLFGYWKCFWRREIHKCCVSSVLELLFCRHVYCLAGGW